MPGMVNGELIGVGIAPTGYARGAHAVVTEIGAVKGLMGVQPLWMHSIDFPEELASRLHGLTRRHVERAELLELDGEIGGHYAEVVEDLLLGARIGGREIQYVAIQGVQVGSEDEHPGANLPAELEVANAGITVVTDFAAADMAEGGCGAPVGCLADCQMFADKDLGTLVVSLGALASVTVIPRMGSERLPVGFVTGPGTVLNEILEASQPVVELEMSGMAPMVMVEPREELLKRLLRHPFLEIEPPKSVGIGPFGLRLLEAVRHWPEAQGADFAELRATFYAFTAWSIAGAVKQFVPSELEIERVIVGGMGAGKAELMAQLERALPDRPVLRYEMFGLPGGAHDAIAAAVLGAATLAGIPNNVPSCTGARQEAVMGKIAQGKGYNSLRDEALILRNHWFGT